jgi:uncharacterized Tic20 family protein
MSAMPDPLQQPAQPTPPASDVPPGWHADPQGGGQRWWDGTRWTEHTSAASGAGSATAGAMATTSDSRNWATAAHLSALIGLLVGFNFVGPLVVYLIKRDDDPYVRQQAAEALNFNLSFFLYGIVAGIITFVLTLLVVGLLLIPVLIAGAVAWLVLVIIAAMKSNRGEAYRYPLTIRLVS